MHLRPQGSNNKSPLYQYWLQENIFMKPLGSRPDERLDRTRRRKQGNTLTYFLLSHTFCPSIFSLS